MVNEISLEQYKGTNIEKNFKKSSFKTNFISEQILQPELDITKASNMNPNLTIVRVWDSRGFWTIKHKNLNKESVNQNEHQVKIGDEVFHRGESYKVSKLLKNGFLEVKDKSGKVFKRSLKNLQFKHPTKDETARISGEHTIQDYHFDGTESVHKMIREGSYVRDNSINNKQIDSVIKQFFDSDVKIEDLKVDLKQIEEDDYRNSIKSPLVGYGTSGLGQKTVAQVKREFNEKSIEAKAHEIKKHLKLNKFEYGLNSEKVKNITKELVRLASSGVDVYKEIEERVGKLREHDNRALSFKFHNIVKDKATGQVSFDKYGRVNIKGSLTIDDSLLNDEGEFPFRIKYVKTLGIKSDKIKSLDGIRINSVDDVSIESESLKSLKGLPEEVESLKIKHCNSLNNFNGFPKIVKGDLFISDTPIKSLKGIPEVGKSIKLINTEIDSLKGIQEKIEGSLDISHNKNLKSFKDGVNYVKANLKFNNTSIETTDGFPKYVGAFETNNKKIGREEFIKQANEVKYPNREEVLPVQISRNLDSKEKEFRDKWFLDYL